MAVAGADTALAEQISLAMRGQQFGPEAIDRLKADPQYDYDRDLHLDNLWWDRLMQWLGDKLEDLFGTDTGRWVFSHLDTAILLVALGLLIFYLRKRLFHGGVVANAARPRQVLAIGEDLQREDLDQLLAEAERAGHWRLALRYQYLIVLRRLIEEGTIRFRPESTDLDYLRQMKDPAQRSTLGELSFLFKWAWYGDAPMDEARYRSLAPAFARFPYKTTG